MSRPAPSDAILDRLLSLHPKIIDLTLDRVWRLLAAVGNPERALPRVVHIAGTNGKGSTLAMIRAGLAGVGCTAHAYTSPHLARFHERVRIAGELISEPELTALLEECEDANGSAPITFFEITTVAALLAFSRHRADYTLLEVGLGGRLDATNVIERPRLTVITPVSVDHQQYLGETLSEIAAEKAGILKEGVPCVVAAQDSAALAVIEARAEHVGAPLFIHGQHWLARREHGRLVYEDENGVVDLDPPALLGAHQFENAGTAVAALQRLGVSERGCAAAMRDVTWPARMQRLRHGPLVEQLSPDAELWLDGGHNIAAGHAIASVFRDWVARAPVPVHLIVGMLETKSAEDFLRPLGPFVSSISTVAIPDTVASFTAEALMDIARDVVSEATTADTASEALDQIERRSEGPHRVVICGSLYLAGHILRENG